MTNSQEIQIAKINEILTGNLMTPSEFKNSVIESIDPFTKSLLVRLNFSEHTGLVYIRVKGGITDINGKNLKKYGYLKQLPELQEVDLQ